jgi:hypothetical protein
LLTDPQQALPPYDAVLLVSPAAALRPGFLEALRPLVGAIDLQTMQEANKRVDVDGKSPAQVSVWLLETMRSPRRQRAAGAADTVTVAAAVLPGAGWAARSRGNRRRLLRNCWRGRLP